MKLSFHRPFSFFEKFFYIESTGEIYLERFTNLLNYLHFFYCKFLIIKIVFIFRFDKIYMGIFVFVGKQRMCSWALGRSTTRTCIFTKSKSRKGEYSECKTGLTQYYKFFLWSTDRLPNLCLSSYYLLCWNKWSTEQYNRWTCQYRFIQKINYWFLE